MRSFGLLVGLLTVYFAGAIAESGHGYWGGTLAALGTLAVLAVSR